MRSVGPEVKVYTDVWRQRSMMSLHHLPTTLIVSVSTMSSRGAMAPPARMNLSQTPYVLNPTCVPEIPISFLSALVISALLMAEHLFLWCILASGMLLPARCCQRSAARHWIVSTTHALV